MKNKMRISVITLILLLNMLGFTVAKDTNNTRTIIESEIPSHIYIRKMDVDPSHPEERLSNGSTIPPGYIPTEIKRVCENSNSFVLDILIGKKHQNDPEGKTQELYFEVKLTKDDLLQINILDHSIKKSVGSLGFNRNIDRLIEYYNGLKIAKSQWTQIFYNLGYNKGYWELWWGDKEPK